MNGGVNMTKICAMCKKAFVPNSHNQKYCGKTCSAQAHSDSVRRRYIRLCEAAGRTVTTRKPVTDVQWHRKTNHKDTDTLCWYCIHAVPGVKQGREYGCPWSLDFEAVKGWKTYNYINHEGYERTRVLYCPMFKEG